LALDWGRESIRLIKEPLEAEESLNRLRTGWARMLQDDGTLTPLTPASHE
jgi:hypothetical protein